MPTRPVNGLSDFCQTGRGDRQRRHAKRGAGRHVARRLPRIVSFVRPRSSAHENPAANAPDGVVCTTGPARRETANALIGSFLSNKGVYQRNVRLLRAGSRRTREANRTKPAIRGIRGPKSRPGITTRPRTGPRAPRPLVGPAQSPSARRSSRGSGGSSTRRWCWQSPHACTRPQTYR